MKIVLGLGNPGLEYEGTRHNVGFDVVDQLSDRMQGRWKKPFLRPLLFFSDISTSALLIKPLTFMNRSGAVLPYLRDRWRVSPPDILVIVDNMDLPPGRLRYKSRGSSAGHNGLKSIMHVLGDGNFSRLYVGIGRPEPDSGIDIVSHVLGQFNDNEKQSVEQSLVKAADACMSWLHGADHETMSRTVVD